MCPAKALSSLNFMILEDLPESGRVPPPPHPPITKDIYYTELALLGRTGRPNATYLSGCDSVFILLAALLFLDSISADRGTFRRQQKTVGKSAHHNGGDKTVRYGLMT
jgi:hypothetical protein